MNIANTIKTPRNFDANRPFGAAHMTRQPSKPTDPSTLVICDDPLPSHRASAGKKYDATFKALKLGQGIKCKPAEVGRVAGAMRKYVQVNKVRATVRSVKDYGDGMGRVWLWPLPDAKPLKAVAK